MNVQSIIEQPPTEELDPARQALVAEWCDKIKAARDQKWKPAFDAMRQDMIWAKHGCSKEWMATGRYRANLLGRGINSKVANLYARNPTVVVKRRQTIDSQVWDGTGESLQAALQGAQMGDPISTQILLEAQTVIANRAAVDKFARTLQLVIQDSWGEAFKRDLKGAVRRAATCGVAYVEFGIFRETDKDPDILEQIADTRSKIAALEQSQAEMSRLDDPEGTAELEALRLSMTNLEMQAEVVLREGIIYAFPRATDIIPDPACRELAGFKGAEWVARQYDMTAKAIERTFGTDISTHLATAGNLPGDKPKSSYSTQASEGDGRTHHVWHVFDKLRQEHLWLCDGYPDFLAAPAEPEVYRPGFWPWIALTFNDIEAADGDLFPPSDVSLLREIQDEHNRARHGRRLHRQANRPVYIAPMNAFDDGEMRRITQAESFEIIPIRGLQPGQKSADVLVPVQKIPLEPDLYDTGDLRLDFQLISGQQEANLGAVSGGTATESSIAEASRSRELSEDTDALDGALAMLAAEVGAMAVSALSDQTVKAVAGEGASWPSLARQQLAQGLSISIRAGSSGRPNKAQELANLERIAPYLQQTPGLNPLWFLRTALERMEDDLDLAEAIAPALPSITAINAMSKGPPAGPPGSDNPDDQGSEGGDQSERPPEPEGGAQPAYGDSGSLPA